MGDPAGLPDKGKQMTHHTKTAFTEKMLLDPYFACDRKPVFFWAELDVTSKSNVCGLFCSITATNRPVSWYSGGGTSSGGMPFRLADFRPGGREEIRTVLLPNATEARYRPSTICPVPGGIPLTTSSLDSNTICPSGSGLPCTVTVPVTIARSSNVRWLRLPQPVSSVAARRQPTPRRNGTSINGSPIFQQQNRKVPSAHSEGRPIDCQTIVSGPQAAEDFHGHLLIQKTD